jgi:hypothetical protein
MLVLALIVLAVLVVLAVLSRSRRWRNAFRLAALALRGELPVHVSKVRAVSFALSGGVTPLFQSGSPSPTYTTTTATIVAGMLCEITGDRSVGPAGAASVKVVGVAKQSASAIGDKIAVDSGGVYLLKAAGAIAAGDQLKPGALGTVSAGVVAADDPRIVVGIALAAIGDTLTGPVLLKIG